MESDGSRWYPPKLLNLIKAYYHRTRTRVRCYGQDSSFFNVSSGVRQGCALSPTLFNYAIDWIMEQALPGYLGVVVGRNFHLTDLDYADDIAVLGESYRDIQTVLNRIQEKAAAIGMRINASKTKILSAGIPQAERSSVTLNGETLEETDSFKYLGCTFIGTGQGINEIEARINAARAAFCRLQRRLWSRPEIRLRTKIRIYQALVRSILLYGCETWPIRKADLRCVEVFDHYNLRAHSTCPSLGFRCQQRSPVSLQSPGNY